MRISDWSSDVCSSDLAKHQKPRMDVFSRPQKAEKSPNYGAECEQLGATRLFRFRDTVHNRTQLPAPGQSPPIRTASFGTARTMNPVSWGRHDRSEEHTSELQSLMRISYAVFCLKK